MGKSTPKEKPKTKPIQPQYRKLLGVLVNSWFFNVFCKKGVFMVDKSPIPDDAKYVSSFLDPSRDGYIIVFEHKNFRELKEGECIPIDTGVRLLRLYGLEKIWEKVQNLR